MNKPHTNNKEVERIVEEFTEKMELYDMGIGLQDNLFDWLRTTLHQELQKAREEERWRCAGIVDNFAMYSPEEQGDIERNELLEEIKESIHDPKQMPIDDNGKLIFVAPEKLPKAPESELDQPTDCTCDGFDTCYKHSEQLDQTFNPTN